MKCFAVFTTLVALTVADPLLPLIANRAALGYGYGNLGYGNLGYGNLGYGRALPVAAGYATGAHLGYAGLAHPVAAGVIAKPAAVVAKTAVVAKAAPVVPEVVATQYQAGDELGNYEYGYKNINSAKQEKGNAYGGVMGSYEYVDSYGIPQKVNYVADALGFRTTASNLPATPATLGLNSVHRLYKRGVAVPTGALANAYGAIPTGAIAPAYGALPIGASAGPYGYAGRNAISEPAVREATLLRIKNNPGHAVSYIVH